MVISDFAYADVAFDGYKPPSFLASPGAIGRRRRVHDDEQGLQHGRLARRLLLPAIAEMIKALATIKGYYDYGMFQAIQIAAIMALRHGDAGVEEPVADLPKPPRRAVRKPRANRLERRRRPRPACSVWVPIPEPWRSRMSTMDFGMMLLEKGNVAVSPGSGFGPAGEGFLRMSLVENEARLRQAVRQIKACLKDAETSFAPSAPASVTV